MFKLKKDIDFLSMKKQALIFSVSFILISLVSLFFKGLNLGIDFTGGTLVSIQFEKPINAEKLRNILKKQSSFTKIEVQSLNNGTDYFLKTVPINANLLGKFVSNLISYLEDEFGQNVKVLKSDLIGSKIGNELRDKSGVGFIVAILLIVLYISFRFQYKFAIGAVIALIHDVMFIFGIFSLFGIEFNLTALGAVLAVVGYSLNDTIVIYDRIREKIKSFLGGELLKIINLAINETISRTLVTSFTTLIVVIVLLIFGGEALYQFSLALLIGIVIGTYSSIFIASNLLTYLKLERKDLINEEKEKKLDISP